MSSQSDPVFLVSGYAVNRDYEWLADEMERRSLICLVDFDDDLRDVAHTIWTPGLWQLSARGTCYVWARSREEFIRDCARANVEIIESLQK